MSFKGFPSPHVHIASLDSASTPEAFAEREVELGTGAICVTDHGTMGACNEVYELAQKNNLIPILGLEAYLRDDDCPILSKFGIEKDEKGTFASYNKYYHFTIHAQDNDAYEALVRELSQADFRAEQHGSERKPLFTWEQVERLGGYNLTMTSGCLIGVVQRHLLSDRPDIAIAYYEKMRSIPKAGNFYVEAFPHKCTHYWVQGVFVTLEGGEKIKFWKGKKLRTTTQETTAELLAKVWSRGMDCGKLVAVMNNRKWEDQPQKQILKVEVIEDFMQNECRPWAPDGDVQLGANKFMLALAERYGDNVLISDDAHFAVAEDKVVQDSRLTSAGGSWKFHNSYHRQSGNEAAVYFRRELAMSDYQIEKMIDSNREWSQKFKDFKFKERKSLPTKFYPENTLMHFKNLIDKHGRMDWASKEWVDRLKSEIDLLHLNGTIDLLPYFFLAEEVNSFYEQNEWLTGPGRGSAAGLLSTYLLGITHVIPLKYNLSRDRFLTVDRIKSGKLPDIDMDFPDRDPLTDPQNGWLYRRFGDHVAAISTDTKLRLKSSIKDVFRSRKGYVPPEIEVLCKKLPMPPQGIEDYDFVFGYTGDDGKEVKGLLDESKELQEFVRQYPTEWGIVKKMLGITRQKSRHACAYVIANEPIHNFIPLTTISGIRTTQYTATSVEARGGLKMDFLGLNSLKDLQGAIKMIQERNGGKLKGDYYINNKRVPGFRIIPFKGQLYDIWDLPEDQAVFNNIASGDTETVFQLNTPSARQWLRQFNFWKDEANKVKAIDSIEAISAFTALDRPGPLDAEVKDPKTNRGHNMLVEFANRARGAGRVGNIPALDKMLPETYGVMVYQEQLEAAYKDLTGCTATEAEEFRRNVAKKKMDKVKKVYPGFMERASEKIGREQSQAVFDQMVTFGEYGFNKSHSVCYSIIAYASAFLKHYYPVEWWCSVLRNADKKEIAEKFWKHCKQYILLPDIRYSGHTFEIEGDSIRAPLSFLQGVGPAAHAELMSYQPFTSIEDLCRKIAQKKKTTAKPSLDKDGNQKVDVKTGKIKMRAGTSALNSGVMNKLIVSGVADSLFPEGQTVLEKLSYYQEVLARTANETNGTKTKPKKVDEQYVDMDALTRYQLRKTILPIYSEDLQDLVADYRSHGMHRVNGKGYRYTYLPEKEEEAAEVTRQRGAGLNEPQPVVNGAQLKFLNSETAFEEGQVVQIAATGYVISERRFRYKENTCEALSLVVDVDGETFELVKWPERKTGKLKAPKQDLTGNIVLILATRYRSDRPFALDAVVVIKEAFNPKVEESSISE